MKSTRFKILYISLINFFFPNCSNQIKIEQSHIKFIPNMEGISQEDRDDSQILYEFSKMLPKGGGNEDFRLYNNRNIYQFILKDGNQKWFYLGKMKDAAIKEIKDVYNQAVKAKIPMVLICSSSREEINTWKKKNNFRKT